MTVNDFVKALVHTALGNTPERLDSTKKTFGMSELEKLWKNINQS